MATIDFDIREVLEGMKAMNALKADIRTLLQFFLPYLSDWAQTEVNKARRKGDNSFKEEPVDVFDFAANDNHIIFRCHDEGGHLFLRLIFRDDIGEDTIILEGYREQESARTPVFSKTFRVEVLSKWDVLPCFDFMQQLMAKLSERYPDEIAIEVAPFLEARSRVKTK